MVAIKEKYYRELWEWFWAADKYFCCFAGCHGKASQLGHRIPQYHRYEKKYGMGVVHNPINLVPCCGLTHNQRFEIPKGGLVEVNLAKTIHAIGEDWVYHINDILSLPNITKELYIDNLTEWMEAME